MNDTPNESAKQQELAAALKRARAVTQRDPEWERSAGRPQRARQSRSFWAARGFAGVEPTSRSNARRSDELATVITLPLQRATSHCPEGRPCLNCAENDYRMPEPTDSCDARCAPAQLPCFSRDLKTVMALPTSTAELQARYGNSIPFALSITCPNGLVRVERIERAGAPDAADVVRRTQILGAPAKHEVRLEGVFRRS